MKTQFKLFTLLLGVILLVGCKDTFYNYDIVIMEKTCKDKGGIHRFTTDMWVINCWCNDGSYHELESR